MKLGYLVPLVFLFVSGCIGASTFGLKEEVYQRTLMSVKDKSVSLEVYKADFRGSPEKIGKQKAEFLLRKPELKQVLEDLLSFSRVKLGEADEVKTTMQQHFPNLYNELKSFAKYSSYSEEEVFSFAGSRFAVGGCTLLLRSGEQSLLARNFDWTPTLIDGILANHKGMNNRIASLTMTASFFGAYSGINEKGLAIAIAGINSNKEYSYTGGLSMPIIVRGVLERADNIDSAIEIFKRIPHIMPANYALVDKAGRITVLEVSPPNIVVRKDLSEKGYLTAVNHFQSLDNKTEGVLVFGNSERRIKVVEQFQSTNPNADFKEVLNFMGQVEDGPAMENYSLMMGTLWSIIYLPQSSEMLIRIGLDGKPVTIGFSKTTPLSIKGTLKDKPFSILDFL